MTSLPISHLTLYKHGVGYFVRRTALEGEAVRLSFRVDEMNDILKSLTAIDRGGGQVLGIDYATPQSVDERLAGCTIRLRDGHSLADLLRDLRGRRVCLALADGDTPAGTLVGIDTPPSTTVLGEALVSLLDDETAAVRAVQLATIRQVDILDPQGAADLRFFLETSLSQEDYRQVTVRLTPGSHDLLVSYIAPAPVWRVSYRLLVADDDGADRRALLLGWGIFDNRLEEDLTEISLTLVAGRPISFIYDLYSPFMPDRPVVEEEDRSVAGPVAFEARAEAGGAMVLADAAMPKSSVPQRARAMAAPAPQMAREAVAEATAVAATGEARGELFQYDITTPVSVGRGQSAMVPIVSTMLDYRKDLLYNGRKLPTHPVATLRLTNETGLTLERGPVTVMAESHYLGEAMLPFTAGGGELTVPYAVELGVGVGEAYDSAREIHTLMVQGAYLRIEEWHMRTTTYQLNSKLPEEAAVLVEHPRRHAYDLFDTPEAAETTAEQWRFAVAVPAGGEAVLVVRERTLQHRQERLERQSYAGLQRYLRAGLIDRDAFQKVVDLLALWEQIADRQKEMSQCETERQKVHATQQNIRQNIGALGASGKEGAMRSRYVERLEESESDLQQIGQREARLKQEITALEQRVEQALAALA